MYGYYTAIVHPTRVRCQEDSGAVINNEWRFLSEYKYSVCSTSYLVVYERDK